MKRIGGIIILSLLLLSGTVACGERYVKASQKALRQSVSLEVTGIVDVWGSTTTVKALGAGVWISPNGHILTCAHLFYFQEEIITIAFESYENRDYHVEFAELLYVSKKDDLALLKALDYKNKYYAVLAHPFKTLVGQEVIVVGNPMGLSFSVTNGIISSMYRDIGRNYNMIQSNAAVNPGNSGGGVFNLKGELVGITSFMITPARFEPIFTGLGFSVASSEIIRFLGKFVGVYKAIKPR